MKMNFYKAFGKGALLVSACMAMFVACSDSGSERGYDVPQEFHENDSFLC